MLKQPTHYVYLRVELKQFVLHIRNGQIRDSGHQKLCSWDQCSKVVSAVQLVFKVVHFLALCPQANHLSPPDLALLIYKTGVFAS